MVNLKVVASVLWGVTVINNVQLLRLASTASPYANVVMKTVTLCLDVNVQYQVIYIYIHDHSLRIFILYVIYIFLKC